MSSIYSRPEMSFYKQTLKKNQFPDNALLLKHIIPIFPIFLYRAHSPTENLCIKTMYVRFKQTPPLPYKKHS